MTRRPNRARICLAVILVCSAACGDSGVTPVAPTLETPTVVTPSVAVPAPLDLTRARIYTSEPLRSRYLLFDDGSFAMQYAPWTVDAARLEFRGRYTLSNGDIVFDWDAWSAAGPWGASGTITDDVLSVEYNTVMMFTDFIDGVYQRTQ